MSTLNNRYINNIATRDELNHMCKYIIDKSSIKHMFFIYIFYIIISSQNFDKNCLNINEKYQNNNKFIHLLKKSFCFILIYIIIDLLINIKVL